LKFGIAFYPTILIDFDKFLWAKNWSTGTRIYIFIHTIFRELSICFKSARWDHPERNIKNSKTKN